MKITILGGGNMGQAIARALKEKFEVNAAEIMVSDIDPKKLEDLRELEIDITDKNIKAVDNANVVILAVKPQHLDELLKEIKPHLKENQILLSIAAGVKISKIKDLTDNKNIVRVMPNLPAQIGEGASVWTASPDMDIEEKDVIKDILKCFGKEFEVENEDQIDIATALSGSGPAYVFYFMECLANGAAFLGMPEGLAVNLAKQTLLGASKFADISSDTLEELRKKVTSKGGTTEAALKYLDQHDFKKILTYAVKSAYDRAKELGEK
jgi:pyrroline-5-carboxylate reductase